MTHIRFHARSDPGRRRPTNEDAFAISSEAGFCVLCDGMGGHSSGEVASRMAVEIIGARLDATLHDGERGAVRTFESRERAVSVLKACVLDALRAANQAIYERGATEPGVLQGRNMGTTLALLCVVEGAAVVAHIGDSRIYRVREGEIERLTRDHSVTADELGTARSAGKKRKYVTRALGTRPEVLPEITVHDAFPGDRFVACTDGLTDAVRDEEIAASVTGEEADPRLAPTALVNLANERGGRDNVTVIVGVVALPSVLEPEPASALLAPPPLEPPPVWDSADLEEG